MAEQYIPFDAVFKNASDALPGTPTGDLARQVADIQRGDAEYLEQYPPLPPPPPEAYRPMGPGPNAAAAPKYAADDDLDASGFDDDPEPPPERDMDVVARYLDSHDGAVAAMAGLILEGKGASLSNMLIKTWNNYHQSEKSAGSDPYQVAANISKSGRFITPEQVMQYGKITPEVMKSLQVDKQPQRARRLNSLRAIYSNNAKIQATKSLEEFLERFGNEDLPNTKVMTDWATGMDTSAGFSPEKARPYIQMLGVDPSPEKVRAVTDLVMAFYRANGKGPTNQQNNELITEIRTSILGRNVRMNSSTPLPRSTIVRTQGAVRRTTAGEQTGPTQPQQIAGQARRGLLARLREGSNNLS